MTENETSIDPSILAAALDAWERDRERYDVTPYQAFTAAHPTESAYLWQLARGARPPVRLVDEALNHLLEWGLIDASGTMTPLGRRLLDVPSASQTRRRARRLREGSSRASSPRRAAFPLGRCTSCANSRPAAVGTSERAPEWRAVERLGLASRVAGSAQLTPDGEEFVEGVAAGSGEVVDDGWSREQAQMYLDMVGAPSSVFDAGHQAGVRVASGLDEPSGAQAGRRRGRSKRRPRDARTSAAPERRATKPPKGTWAWTEHGQVFVPDKRVTPRRTDERVPLRGYGTQDAVRRAGKIIGWAERP